MLNLYCGSALDSYLADLLGGKPCPLLFVCPDKNARLFCQDHIYRDNQHTVSQVLVLTLEELMDTLFSNFPGRKGWVGFDSELLLIRSLIESDLRSYDYLVGRNAIPRLNHSSLVRIVHALDRIRNESDEGARNFPNHPRYKQLSKLLARVNGELEVSGEKLERFGLREALSSLSINTWKSAFPGFSQVLFMDFANYDDTLLFAINHIGRCVQRCDVLLDYFPDSSTDAGALETMFLRLTETADNVYTSATELLLDEQKKVILSVNCSTVKSEIESVIGLVKAWRANNKDLTIAIGLPNWEEYFLEIENLLSVNDLEFSVEARESLIRSSFWQLLETIAQCAGSDVGITDLATLFRSPGFLHLLDDQWESVDGWEVASRLEMIASWFGETAGWKYLLAQIPEAIVRIHSTRKGRGLLSDFEQDADKLLVDVINATFLFIQQFQGKRTLHEWTHVTSRVLMANPEELAGSNDLHLRLIRQFISSLYNLDNWHGTAPDSLLSYHRFLSLLKTLLHGVQEQNTSQLLRSGISICRSDTVSSLRADCCIILGCNDGQLPRYGKPGPDVLDSGAQLFVRNRIPLDQHINWNRLRRNNRRLILFTPEMNGLERLLPSQFVDRYIQSGVAIAITPPELLSTFNIDISEAIAIPSQTEIVNELRGIRLDHDELSRFQQTGVRIGNTVQAVSIINARRSMAPTEYDGIISDTELKEWLRGWSDRHVYSVAQLDNAIGCVFRFYTDRMLNLEEDEAQDDLLPAHLFGSITHDVLAVFYRRWTQKNKQVPSLQNEFEARVMLADVVSKDIPEIENLSQFAHDLLELKLFGAGGLLGFKDGTESLLDTQSSGVLGQFLKMEIVRTETATEATFAPAHFEVGFGMGLLPDDDPLSVDPPIKVQLDPDTWVNLRGRIDRIDISPDGVFAITDYKTGRTPERKHVLNGYKAQLPIYILVGSQLLQCQDSSSAAGGLYYSLRNDGKDKVSGIMLKNRYQKALGISGRSCLSDEDFEIAMDNVKHHTANSLKAIANGFLVPTWRDEDVVCGYCPYERFCYRNVEKNRKIAVGMKMITEQDTYA